MGKMMLIGIVGGVVAAGAGAFFLMHKSAAAAPNQPQSLITAPKIGGALPPGTVAVAAPAPRVTTVATLTQSQRNQAQAAVMLQQAAALRNQAMAFGAPIPQNPQYGRIVNLNNQASALEAQARSLA